MARWKQTRDGRVVKANEHAIAELSHLEQARKHSDQAKTLEAYATHHRALKEKYLESSDRPWRALDPDPPPPAPLALGDYWFERNDYRQAVTAYEDAIRANPDDGNAHNKLAWILATCPDPSVRNGKRAVTIARQIYDWSEREVPEFIDTLAAALAETGDFQAAVETQREAIGRLSKGDLRQTEFRLRLQGYEGKQPYRLEATKER